VGRHHAGGKVKVQPKMSSVSWPSAVEEWAVRLVGRPPSSRRPVEGVAAVIHGDAAARQRAFAAPVRPPFVDTLGVGVAEGLHGHQVHGTDDSLVENAAHDLDHWRMFVVVAGEEHRRASRACRSMA